MAALVAPVLVVLAKSGQASQVLAELAPTSVENVPKRQGTHRSARSAATAYVPAGHVVQLLPSALYVPGAHGWHAAALAWPTRPPVLEPLLQTMQPLVPVLPPEAVSLAYVLTGHGRHVSPLPGL